MEFKVDDTEQNEDHSIMLKSTVYKGDIISANLYALCNIIAKYIKKKAIKHTRRF